MRKQKPFREAWREVRQERKARDELRKQKQDSSMGNKLVKFGSNLDNFANNWIRHVTIPIILFILGCVTFPVGILFWIVALYMMSSTKK